MYVVCVAPKRLALCLASHPYLTSWMYVQCPKNRFQPRLSNPRLEGMGCYKLRRRFQRRLNQKYRYYHLLGLILQYPFFHGSSPTFFSHNKHSKMGFPCLAQDAIFSDHAHTIIIQQHLSPCKVFKGEFAKFY